MPSIHTEHSPFLQEARCSDQFTQPQLFTVGNMNKVFKNNILLKFPEFCQQITVERWSKIKWRSPSSSHGNRGPEETDPPRLSIKTGVHIFKNKTITNCLGTLGDIRRSLTGSFQHSASRKQDSQPLDNSDFCFSKIHGAHQAWPNYALKRSCPGRLHSAALCNLLLPHYITCQRLLTHP